LTIVSELFQLVLAEYINCSHIGCYRVVNEEQSYMYV